MKKCWMISAAVSAVLWAGCIFSGTPLKFEQFTAELPESSAQLDYKIGAVSNISGAGREFLVREPDSAVKTDRSRRWLNEPGVMLRSALSVASGGTQGYLSAQIVRFEFSNQLKSLDGVIVFTLKKAEKQQTVVCRESVPVEQGNYGGAAAELFERCIKKVSGVKL